VGAGVQVLLQRTNTDWLIHTAWQYACLFNVVPTFDPAYVALAEILSKACSSVCSGMVGVSGK